MVIIQNTTSKQYWLLKKRRYIWADVQSADEGAVQWNAALALGLEGLQTDHPKALIDF